MPTFATIHLGCFGDNFGVATGTRGTRGVQHVGYGTFGEAPTLRTRIRPFDNRN